MEPELTPEELRILGALIEKGITTPDYYPMTLNALTAACNQKSNRDPVLEYGEKTVVRALDSLREKGLARVVSGPDMRVPKYYHRFTEVREFSAPDVAVLCELMLRGPQTPGELRSRGSRMHPFESLAEVEAVLQSLMERPAGAAVLRLPRQPGFKESRFAHLLGAPPVIEEPSTDGPDRAGDSGGPRPEAARLAAAAEDERLERLEAAVAGIVEEIASLRSEFKEFRGQFE